MLLKLKPYVQVLRPLNLTLVALTFLLIRFFHTNPLLSQVNQFGLDFTTFILNLSSVIITMASGNLINDVFDIGTDKINKPNKVIVSVLISKKSALAYYISLVSTSLFLAFVFGNGLFLSLIITAHVLLFLYAILFKRIAILGNLIIAILSGLIPLISVWFDVNYAFSISNNEKLIALYELPLFLALLAFSGTFIREIIKDMEDVNGDKKNRSYTLPILIGLKSTSYILIFLIFILLGFIFFSPIINLNNMSFYYFTLFVVTPLLATVFRLYKSKKSTDYNKASNYIKIAMLCTILFVAFNGLFNYDII